MAHRMNEIKPEHVITKKEYSKWPISSRKSYPSFVWRLTQFIAYGISIYFLLNLVNEFQQTRNKEKYYTWSAILVFASLQSSAAIYDINNAGGGMFTAFFIIGHLSYVYFFLFCALKIGFNGRCSISTIFYSPNN